MTLKIVFTYFEHAQSAAVFNNNKWQNYKEKEKHMLGGEITRIVFSIFSNNLRRSQTYTNSDLVWTSTGWIAGPIRDPTLPCKAHAHVSVLCVEVALPFLIGKSSIYNIWFTYQFHLHLGGVWRKESKMRDCRLLTCLRLIC